MKRVEHVKLAAAMERGHWYTRGDLMRSTGLTKNELQARLETAVPKGLIERRKRPDEGSGTTGRFEYRRAV